ncbi:response regulator transcription factor [Actinoplanes solisilvae]|uniref:response regulator transcription factor n=1 Tax=Actinoplanes solisilvae TaxID=2486853 RepID=UPI000FDB27D3|nr:response regulator transcription factor [Actinoplanes solisilvae]
MRIAIADDHAIFRTAVARCLRDSGFEVLVDAATGAELVTGVRRHSVDVAIIDVKLSEDADDEGIAVARTVKKESPGTAILMLSAETATTQAIQLLRDFETGIGYLRKDEVDIVSLGPQLTRLVAGEPVLGRSIASRLLRPARRDSALDSLTRQETEVLKLMAEGYSNMGIAGRLSLTERTIEDHAGRIFDKLGISLSAGEGRATTNKRVLAVLTWLRLAS